MNTDKRGARAGQCLVPCVFLSVFICVHLWLLPSFKATALILTKSLYTFYAILTLAALPSLLMIQSVAERVAQ